MEIHQLEYFAAFAEMGGFIWNVERCNVTQPSLSQQIKKLEQKIGHALRRQSAILLSDRDISKGGAETRSVGGTTVR